MPPDDAYARPVALGRELPNRDPYLPEPDIPPQYTWWEVSELTLRATTSFGANSRAFSLLSLQIQKPRIASVLFTITVVVGLIVLFYLLSKA